MHFDLAGLEQAAADLEEQMAQPDFWNDPENARKIMQKTKEIKGKVNMIRGLEKQLQDVREYLLLLGEAEDNELESEIRSSLESLKKAAADAELKVLLNQPYDHNNAILSLHPGAGGTESQDWAQMLLRMYTRWAERSGFEVEVWDYQPGEEAGIKDATLLIKGSYAYGFLKAERGIHRLVRISPFDASGRRHTSFASVEVLPEVDEDIEVDIRPEDLRIDTYRSGGAGGQHVNKTDSAVRITHLPTGIVVQCQNERSQHSNKETALKLLKAKLYERQLEEQRKELEAMRGEVREIAWGNQIRSYVFHPYTMVKDHRTNVEAGNIQAVMDGEIDAFIEAYLKQEALKGQKAAE